MVQFWLHKKKTESKSDQHSSLKKEENLLYSNLYIKKALMRTWKRGHKKYKANKSTRTHVTKEHNNRDTNNTLIKTRAVCHIVTLPFTLKNYLMTKEEL